MELSQPRIAALRGKRGALLLGMAVALAAITVGFAGAAPAEAHAAVATTLAAEQITGSAPRAMPVRTQVQTASLSIGGGQGRISCSGTGAVFSSLVCSAAMPAGLAAGNVSIRTEGGLIDANGRITNRLDIRCGDLSSACDSVRFAMLGTTAGTMDLRLSYAPLNAAGPGTVEDSTTGFSLQSPDPCVARNNCILQIDNPTVRVGEIGTATLRFGREFLSCGANIICVDPTTGAPLVVNQGSILNGTVVFTIADSNIASWVNAQPTAARPVPSSTSGFVTTANTTLVRCGFFPTTTLPSGTVSTPFQGGAQPLSQFFGGCESASAQFRGNNPGFTAVNAAFIPDLPGATPILGALPPANFTQATTFQSTRTLTVIGAAPVGDVQLTRGCNNVSPTVSEAASAYAARVNPSGALVAIWEHQAASNTFRGFSPAAGAPNDLMTVTRLRPVFVCVSGPATLAQPPA
jgi:hypothetical protein